MPVAEDASKFKCQAASLPFNDAPTAINGEPDETEASVARLPLNHTVPRQPKTHQKWNRYVQWFLNYNFTVSDIKFIFQIRVQVFTSFLAVINVLLCVYNSSSLSLCSSPPQSLLLLALMLTLKSSASKAITTSKDTVISKFSSAAFFFHPYHVYSQIFQKNSLLF